MCVDKSAAMGLLTDQMTQHNELRAEVHKQVG